MRTLAVLASLFILAVLAPIANEDGTHVLKRHVHRRHLHRRPSRHLAALRKRAEPRREYGYGLIRFRGHGPELWNRAYRYERLKVRALKRKLRGSWHTGVASFYGTDGTSGGCGRANGAYTFAAGGSDPPSPYVACGQRVMFCLRACVIGIRTDSGPYVSGRQFDVSTEMASVLGFVSAGTATLRWRLLG